jgi:predicted amidophosphoribosyltransferase
MVNKNNIIKRVKNTVQQSRLNREDRIKNLNNCFKINEKFLKDIKNKTIIIVDDVVSTGTTINEISKVLKNH